ncbi:hypothetical protein FA10DRAFT_285683 [Acaromyces ingoldii]|uniref:Dolichyl-diphosphooligosaccharide--protein glycosyltransferase subunit 4 n=1 Tax=Acaromyces ingoldii TaxID=215250 RepID=A0A316YL69_9BASI|nr:hypothetical protein FA10DRAFT_285683 [Acaromyces ingoldii]PWN89969.1 hypothetical protein FA10DRAFT_285683 [Acaromyces ingoldii]
MINDVQLAALSNWLGSLGMVLIVVYHLFSVNAKRIEARNNAASTAARGGSVVR